MSADFPPSSSRALILTRPPSPPRSPLSQVPLQENEQWQTILHASNQVVLYNPQSHALSVASASTNPPAALTLRRLTALTEPSTRIHPCPYCNQNLPEGFHRFAPPFQHSGNAHEDRWEPLVGQEGELESIDNDPAYHSRASDYFQLLAIANDRFSRTPTPEPSAPVDDQGPRLKRRDRDKSRTLSPAPEEYRTETGAFPVDKMAEGYFKTFFQEECKLGMGASGSVFLCQVCPVFLLSSPILIWKVSTSLTETH